MAADEGKEGRKAWSRGIDSGFVWVAPSPSPEEVTMLEGFFPDIIQIPEAALMESGGCWGEKAILARSFSRWVPPEAFIREFRRAGVPGEIDSVSLAHRCHIFRFEDAQAREKVLARPWVINGQPVATEGWRPEFIPAADSVASILLWVRLPNLPLEFWEDDILRLILLPVGQFLYSDSATHQKIRGGFARACVRIDLRCSLRPGARVRGLFSTFWQQFQFEHLVGICPECGSLHLSGSCENPPPASGSGSSEHRGPFGPWMSAFRQRRPPSVHPPGPKKSSPLAVPSSGSAPPSSPASNGWMEPGKLARRRPKKTGKALVIDDVGPGSKVLGSKGLVDGSEGCSGLPGVPVSASQLAVCAGSRELVKDGPLSDSLNFENQLIPSANPFAILGLDSEVEKPKALRDANPAPSKRPRPVESHSQRAVSNSDKRKGKGLCNAMKTSKGKLSLSDSLIPARGLGSVARSCDQPAGSLVTVPEGDKDQTVKSSGSDHELVVSRLKLAIQGNDIDSSMIAESSSRIAEKASVSSAPLEAVHLMECSTNMVEDQDGSHPP